MMLNSSVIPGSALTRPGLTHLAELIDFAQAHNPETRFTWERARAQAAAFGIARSELYPTLVAAALSQTYRNEVLLGTAIHPRRRSRHFRWHSISITQSWISAGGLAESMPRKLRSWPPISAFNDTHRSIIYRVESKPTTELLNASGQVDAAQVSLSNAQTVQRAAEDRLKQGLATRPDVLEALKRNCTGAIRAARQSLGAKEIAAGNLATALGVPPASIHVQAINELQIPDSINDSVDQAINRAFGQRPDLLQQVAEMRSANARIKEARAAYYPSLNLRVAPDCAVAIWVSSKHFPGHTRRCLAGGVSVSLKLDGF